MGNGLNLYMYVYICKLNKDHKSYLNLKNTRKLFKGIRSQGLPFISEERGLERLAFCNKFHKNRCIGFEDMAICIFLNV